MTMPFPDAPAKPAPPPVEAGEQSVADGHDAQAKAERLLDAWLTSSTGRPRIGKSGVPPKELVMTSAFTPQGGDFKPEAQQTTDIKPAMSVEQSEPVRKRLDGARKVSARIAAADGNQGEADILVDKDGNIKLNDKKQPAQDGTVIVEFAADIDLTANKDNAAGKAVLEDIFRYMKKHHPEAKIDSEMERMLIQDKLDTAREIKWEKLKDSDKEKSEADIIIDKEGNITLNPNGKGKDGQLAISYIVDDSEGQLVRQQKAAVRDLMKYFQMNNPSAKIPDEWLKIDTMDVPPPRMIPSGGTGGTGGGNLLGGGGGGFGGGGGGGTGGGGAFGSGGARGDGGSFSPAGVNRGDYSPDVSPVTSVDGGKLGLSDSFIDRVVKAVSANEGGFTSINPNDAGYGISVGIRQWNQKAGELPTLFQGMAGRGLSEAAIESLKKDGVDPSKLAEKFNQAFGPHAEKLLDQNFVRNTDFHSYAGGDLMNRLKGALGDKDFQAVQRALARDFVRNGAALGYEYGFRSELGLALVCDIVNQKGAGGAKSVLKANGLSPTDQPLANEQAVLERVALNSSRPGAANRYAHLKGSFEGGAVADIANA